MRRIVLAGVLGCLALLAGALAGMAERAPLPQSRDDPPSSIGPAATIDVHVAGWVVAPGVVSILEGSIVADAIEAAGGFRPGARAGAINLAAEISAGAQIDVPGPEGSKQGLSEASDEVLSLNGASASDLEDLPGVGPVLAERIVAYREEHGRFETVEDLLGVSGIGEAKLAALRDLVRP